jgi:hypothetical protein
MTVALFHLRQILFAVVITVPMASAASAGSLLVLDYDAAKTFGTVHIAGGAIDLTRSAMIVTTSSFSFVPSGGQFNEYGAPGVAEFGDAAIHDALVEGANYNGGYWNGTNGILSSTAANNSPDYNSGVGWIDDSIGTYTSFRGVAVGPGQTIIAYAYYGDADLSGAIDTGDQQLASHSLGQTVGIYGLRGSMVNGHPEGMEWVDGDFKQDGIVDNNNDLGWIQANNGLPALYTAGPFAPSFDPATARGVPEPATGGLVATALGAAMCVGYSRRTSKRRGPSR